ncbi:MAG: DUF1559 domain-containing protein [Armatimonadota bacterium]|nr:DUF1559 domain-containing protein [Armatimonadota bacterium]
MIAHQQVRHDLTENLPAKPKKAHNLGSCLSNMKQIGLAVKMYVSDYDETYPMLWYAHMESGMYEQYGFNFRELLLPYIKNDELWRCPSRRPTFADCHWTGYDWGRGSRSWLGRLHGGSYAMNAGRYGRPAAAPGASPAHWSRRCRTSPARSSSSRPTA